MEAVEQDPLLLLRLNVTEGQDIIPCTSPDDTSSDPAQKVDLAQATHIQFTLPRRVSVPIDTPTRFISNDSPVDLRSIYVAWLNRELPIPEYNAAATKLNDELAGTATVHRFAFVERLDLITWLEGVGEESEYIKPLAGQKDNSAVAAAASAALKGSAAPISAQAKSGRGTLDPRLAQIYNGERRMGDRNTVLRGIKPTVRYCPPTPFSLSQASLTDIQPAAGLLSHPQASCHPPD
jgi:parafibromin